METTAPTRNFDAFIGLTTSITDDIIKMISDPTTKCPCCDDRIPNTEGGANFELCSPQNEAAIRALLKMCDVRMGVMGYKTKTRVENRKLKEVEKIEGSRKTKRTYRYYLHMDWKKV